MVESVTKENTRVIYNLQLLFKVLISGGVFRQHF